MSACFNQATCLQCQNSLKQINKRVSMGVYWKTFIYSYCNFILCIYESSHFHEPIH